MKVREREKNDCIDIGYSLFVCLDYEIMFCQVILCVIGYNSVKVMTGLKWAQKHPSKINFSEV